MCLQQKTWVRLHGWVLCWLFVIMLVAWGQLLIAMQSQDSINATLQEQMNENRSRLIRLETWQEKVDQRLTSMTWLMGAASGPLIVEVLKFLIRSRHHDKPNRINERRTPYDHDDQ